ncbi:MAG: efflux RND transporter periplasmic adaptor subunit [Cytophagales bacterium]|nr:efflux RND transporter periplasmic adaptor subunit [Bernardetiaceae bacterium]MDW8211029.1 efflux RND transporter periplasmic adaptor subunit [Cytophagales bacterium]
MTRFYRPMAIAVLLMAVACRQSAPDPLEAKRKRLAELKTQVNKLKEEIALIEAQLAAASPTGAAKKLVEVTPIVLEDFAHYVEVQGNVSSSQNVMIAPEIPGIIVKRFVQVGDMVTKGQPIAEIDAESIRKNIAEIETRLELAQTVYQRQANLWNQKIGSEVQYLQAKNNMEALERALATAKTQLAKAIVRAPIDGMIEDLTQNVGEMANPSIPIGRIVNISQVEINADVSEVYTTAVKRGDQVQVFFPALGKEMTLAIRMVGQYINPNNRTFKIQMRTDNPDGLIKPNMLAVIKIRDFFRKDAVVIPTYLIQQSAEGERFVYLARQSNGKYFAQRVPIKTGRSYGGKTLVEEGLSLNDQLITKGYNEVVHGDELQINPSTNVAKN